MALQYPWNVPRNEFSDNEWLESRKIMYCMDTGRPFGPQSTDEEDMSDPYECDLSDDDQIQDERDKSDSDEEPSDHVHIPRHGIAYRVRTEEEIKRDRKNV